MSLQINKEEVLQELLRLVEADLDAITAGQLASQAGATHAENKAEGDKDMRATESSYLARGLAKRVTALREGAAKLSNLLNRTFTEESLVAMSALVQVEDEDENVSYYYIAPSGAGMVVVMDALKISVVTPSSPLGQAMIGRQVDDEFELQTPQGRKLLTVMALV